MTKGEAQNALFSGNQSQQSHLLYLPPDQSGSMSEGFGEAATRKADFVADVVDRNLHDLVIRCTRMEEIRNYYNISIIGYGASVGPAFSGSLAGRTHVPVGEVAGLPARLENRTKKVPDGAGGIVEQQVTFPGWMDAMSNGGTPMCDAFAQVRSLLEQWLPEHRNSFPPTILHLTDGESTDGDPTGLAQQIMSLSTSDGPVLLFNCHVSSRHTVKIEYPGDEFQELVEIRWIAADLFVICVFGRLKSV